MNDNGMEAVQSEVRYMARPLVKEIDRKHHPLKRSPVELWSETRVTIAEKNRNLDLVFDTCNCRYPVYGPKYLRRSVCVRCQRTIRG